MAERVRRKPCKRCDGNKGDGRKGAKYCGPCAKLTRAESKARYNDKKRSPCQKCGDPKREGHGSLYCQDCYELEEWRRSTRATHKPPKPCMDCGKPVRGKRWKCDDCRVKPALCNRCGVNPLRAPYKNLCEECHAIASVKAQAIKTQWGKDHPKKYKKRRKLTKKQRANYNELRRLDYRLTHNVKPLSKDTYAKRYSKRPDRLPAGPIAARIEWWVATGHSLNGLAESGTIVEKRIREIYNGLVDTVSIDVADKVSMATGTTLESVYAEPSAVEQNALGGDLCA